MTISQLGTQYAELSLQNIGSFISAVRTCHFDKSVSTLSLSNHLDSRTAPFRSEWYRIRGSKAMVSDTDRCDLTVQGIVLAAEMLLLLEMRSNNALRKKMLYFLEYASFLINQQYGFTEIAIDALCQDFVSLGYDWKNIETAISLDTIAYLICNRSERTDSPSAFRYANRGEIMTIDRRLVISSSRIDGNTVRSLDLCKGKIEILTKNTRSEKLKVSEVSNINSLDNFVRTFILTQNETGKKLLNSQMRQIQVGDVVTIKCTTEVPSSDGRIELNCIALDVPFCPDGIIKEEELTKGIHTSDIAPYLFEGDCIRNAVVIEAGEKPVFSIREAYRQFSKETAEKDLKKDLVFEAKAVATDRHNDRINWITSRGYGGISLNMGGIHTGDIAVMTVKNVLNNRNDLYVNIASPKYGYDRIDDRFDEENVILGFAIGIDKAIAMLRLQSAPQEPSEPADAEAIRCISNILSSCSCVKDSLERYKRLVVSGMLANCISDEDTAKRALASSEFLRSCISFAQNGKFDPCSNDGPDEEETRILKCLSLFETPEKIHDLSLLIDSRGMDVASNRIAALILAHGLSDVFSDKVKTNRDSLRERICSIIGTADQFRPEGNRILGKYGKVEGHALEFKSSYVMRNDGSQNVPDIMYQGRGQVFEAVCGFLNTDKGGTVYIGVNNDGDPISSPGHGLNADIEWLTTNYAKLNNTRRQQLGHNIPKADTLDHFVLFLNSEKELYFKETLQSNIIIEATEDQDAIRINVSPSLYEIAVLYKDKTRTEGQAYMRDGGQTVPMRRHDKEKRLMSLKRISKEIGFIVTIQEAIDERHKLIFRNYASGNSGKIEDRFVVPVNLFYNDENVLCYDLVRKEMRQFRLSRIEKIDQVPADPVYSHNFQPQQADVFRWIDEKKSYHIKVRMEVAARNYLLEEYSNAKNLSSDEFYEDSDGKWILDTSLHGLGAIRRFYLGLADKIEILPTEDSDLLLKEIETFIARHLARGQ